MIINSNSDDHKIDDYDDGDGDDDLVESDNSNKFKSTPRLISWTIAQVFKIPSISIHLGCHIKIQLNYNTLGANKVVVLNL